MTTETKELYEVGGLEVKTTKNNKPYAKFTLEIDGEVKSCVMWDADYAKYKQMLKNGNVIAGVTMAHNADFNNYNVVKIVELVEEGKEGIEPEWAEEIFKTIVATVKLMELDDIAVEIEDNKELLLKAPAALKHHHAYVGGLMQHTYETVQAAKDMCRSLNLDEVRTNKILTACTLHDLYKAIEYAQGPDGLPTYNLNFSENHLTHTLCAYVKLSAYNLDVANLVATHHGRVEWGAMREAQSLDELIVHYADMLSSRGGKLTVKDL